MATKTITTPMDDRIIESLEAGDHVLVSGTIYTARDAAHQKMIEALDKGEKLPFDLSGQILYYMGPSPAKPGEAIGSAGPTTSMRVDVYTPQLIKKGLKGVIGKGGRSDHVKRAMNKYKAVYFAAIGGAGALIAQSIKKAEVIAYRGLGAEAVRRLEVENLPVIVVNDVYGGDLYHEGRKKYRQPTSLM
jgi:fumarate hydratase subunit beta